ncbi:MAG: aspartate carbamoyltransferase regulatory subunit [Defluviitaleaceae bacterium]|nr:aspartate carbamoyltransferase regulatory subunit [Defluviitaleaceae bacterium]MCL2264357.1 aspartate carbamoyltransferase regulatory subunit [Defluviitaleaceae bacterium]
MEINSIENGLVIDHLRAGSGLRVLEYLDIDTERGSVALIMNVSSNKHGKKDIIKLENIESIDINVLGLIDHNATIIHIRNGKIIHKTKLSLPKKVANVIRCKNPRCITSIENVPHIFHLADNTGKYRCEYCDNFGRINDGK